MDSHSCYFYFCFKSLYKENKNNFDKIKKRFEERHEKVQEENTEGQAKILEVPIRE